MSLEEILAENTAALKENTDALKRLASLSVAQPAFQPSAPVTSEPVTVTAGDEVHNVTDNAVAEETVKKRGRKPKAPAADAAPETAEEKTPQQQLTDAIMKITMMGDEPTLAAQAIIRSFDVERASQIADDEDRMLCLTRLQAKIREFEAPAAKPDAMSLV